MLSFNSLIGASDINGRSILNDSDDSFNSLNGASDTMCYEYNGVLFFKFQFLKWCE